MVKHTGKKINRFLAMVTLTLLLSGMLAQTAAAATVLFQDDTFQDVMSDSLRIGSNDAGAVNTGVQFGNDVTASENGVITWNISTNRFSFDHAVDITGGLTSTGVVDLSGASENMLRKSATPNASATCTALGEVIINTTTNRLEVCTVIGSPGTWSAPAVTIPNGINNPATCTVADLFYNTTLGSLQVCTATNVWSVAGPQDFESVYGKDADKTLTTSGGNFTVAAGAGTVNLNEATLNTTSTAGTAIGAGASSSFSTSAGNLGLSATTGNVNVTGGAAANNAINLNASNAAGGITGTWGTGGLNFTSATGAFNVSGTGNSTVNATSGNLNLQTTTSGNVALTATGAGKSITFADANVVTPIKFSNTATALNATFPAGAGILDALNSLTSTTVGDGASNVGTSGTFTNFTPATNDVQAALAAIDSKIGAGAANVEDLTFHPEYPDTVFWRSGANNNGTLSSDYDSTNNVLQQFYDWTSLKPTLQNMDIKFRFVLPPDFATVGNFILNFRTGLAAALNNKVDLTVSNATNLTANQPTVCGTSAANFSAVANTFQLATITAATLNTGCTGATALAAGKLIEVDLKLYANNTANAKADVSYVNLAYNN